MVLFYAISRLITMYNSREFLVWQAAGMHLPSPRGRGEVFYTTLGMRWYN
jgi:hypothetical protein